MVHELDKERVDERVNNVYAEEIAKWEGSKAAEIADATGRIIDRCRDYGDNMQFRERWAFAWKDFGKEAAKTDDMK